MAVGVSADAPDDCVVAVPFLDDLPTVAHAVLAQAPGRLEVEPDAVFWVDRESLELGRQAFYEPSLFRRRLMDGLHRGRLRLQDTDARVKSGMKSIIVPNFKIPKRYRRSFLFEESGTDFQQVITVSKEGIRIAGKGSPSPVGNSRCLDWIQECIETVRAEVGG